MEALQPKLSTTFFLFLDLDSAIRKCFPKLFHLVSAFIHHHSSLSLLTLMTSTPVLKHFKSSLNYTFASDPYPFGGTWTSEKDMNMISVEMYTYTE